MFKRLFFILFLVSLVAEEKSLAICAIFKNEAPWLKEWIEYHQMLGVDHFFLYNNGSEDDYQTILAPYIEQNQITLVQWPDQKKEMWKKQIWAWVYTTQVSAYEDAFKRAAGKYRWVAAIDIDEFLVPVKEANLGDVLKKYEEAFPGIEIRWRVYGTADLEEIPPQKLMIEALNRKTAPSHPLNQSYKTILKPTQYLFFAWPPHRCQYKGGKAAYAAGPTEIVIHHYINRTKNYFRAHKLPNKERMDNVKFTSDQVAQMLEIGNEELDASSPIQRFIPPLKKRLQ